MNVGATSDEAWADFLREMTDAHITVIAEGDEVPDDFRSYVRERDYHIRSATQALIGLVAQRGGNVAVEVARGVLCTVEEFERAGGAP